MLEIKKEIQEVNKKIDEIVELFYQQKNEEAYGKLNIALADFIYIIEMIQKQGDEKAQENAGDLNDALKQALEAMEQKDNILLADILKYEVMEKLEDLSAGNN